MGMNILYGILGIAPFLLFMIKFFIHLYLDDIHGYGVKFSYSWMISYFMYYDKTVSKEYEKLKSVCNVVLRGSFYFLISSICIALLKFFLEKL